MFTSSLKNNNVKMYENLTLSEIQCPVCMDICILPVTLPCGHLFCEYCLRTTVQHQAYSCPKCRKRIGNFLRKNKDIVNTQLWTAIQNQYPEEVRKKQNGEDSGVLEFVSNNTIIPKPKYLPGEIREEFESLLQQESEKERLKQQKEEEASARLIKELQEEELKLEEEKKKQLLIDEELARSFAEENIREQQETETAPESDADSRKSNILTRNRSNASTPKGTTPVRKLESYFLTTSTISRGSSDDDSIGQEIHHFKPISTAPKTPPKLMPDGSTTGNHILMVQPNKNLFPSTECNTEAVSTSNIVAAADPCQEEILVMVKENFEQMEKDRLLALDLQKQWEIEEKNAKKRLASNVYNLRNSDKKVKKTNLANKLMRGNSDGLKKTKYAL